MLCSEEMLSAYSEKVSIELAETPEALREAYKLRYQVYCVERDFLTGENGMESDEYDPFSTHIVARWRQTGEVVGTVRLVLPKDPAGGNDYPLQHVCSPRLLEGLPRSRMGEVSRFALAKTSTQRIRGVDASLPSLLRLGLIQGAVRLSAQAGHTHWVAVMEPTLLRLLSATGIHFVPLGPPVEYHGLRQPAVADLVPTLARLAREQPSIWNFVTENGTWYGQSHNTLHEVVLAA